MHGDVRREGDSFGVCGVQSTERSGQVRSRSSSRPTSGNVVTGDLGRSVSQGRDRLAVADRADADHHRALGVRPARRSPRRHPARRDRRVPQRFGCRRRLDGRRQPRGVDAGVLARPDVAVRLRPATRVAPAVRSIASRRDPDPVLREVRLGRERRLRVPVQLRELQRAGHRSVATAVGRDAVHDPARRSPSARSPWRSSPA